MLVLGFPDHSDRKSTKAARYLIRQVSARSFSRAEDELLPPVEFAHGGRMQAARWLGRTMDIEAALVSICRAGVTTGGHNGSGRNGAMQYERPIF